jgi:transposase InsO family protein
MAKAITIIQPETVVRWHRMGFRAWWRWKSRNWGGRPRIDKELRQLVVRMASENPLWGAPRIHGELLKLGFEIAQSTVSKYMPRRYGPPSQSWKTFLRNNADGIASIDFLVVPTIDFRLLYVFVILGHLRRQILWIAVTGHPTADWIAQQMRNAFPWATAPAYLIRDNDRKFGDQFKQSILRLGIRDRPAAPRSPWQNGYVERLIGSIRRDLLDHVIVWSEAHLRRMLHAGLSQRVANTSRNRQGLSDSPAGRVSWVDHIDTVARWTAPSLCADIDFGSHTQTAIHWRPISGDPSQLLWPKTNLPKIHLPYPPKLRLSDSVRLASC